VVEPNNQRNTQKRSLNAEKSRACTDAPHADLVDLQWKRAATGRVA
jgi:hypothetical protein